MSFKDAIKSLGKNKKERKERFRQIEEQFKIQKVLEERQKSANERELERFMKEKREEQIKERLDSFRKERESDMKFNHNPLNTPNITTHTDWEVLKENNMFTGGDNMFSGMGNMFMK